MRMHMSACVRFGVCTDVGGVGVGVAFKSKVGTKKMVTCK